MSRILKILALSAGLLAPVSAAHADIYSDDLARCVVKSTSSNDQTLFMVWMFGAMSVHSAVKGYSTMTAAQRDAAGKAANAVLVRLITKDCRTQTVASIKAGGVESLGSSFRVFGEVAMGGFTNDPNVAASMADLARDTAPSLAGVMKEAGVTAPPTK